MGNCIHNINRKDCALCKPGAHGERKKPTVRGKLMARSLAYTFKATRKIPSPITGSGPFKRLDVCSAVMAAWQDGYKAGNRSKKLYK